MRKILLIGNSPLPGENVRARPAAGLRTWQFLRGLQSFCGGGDGGRDSDGDGWGDGNENGDGGLRIERGDREITLVLIAMPECYEDSVQNDVQSLKSVPGQTYVISKDDSSLLQKIQKIHDQFVPDVIVSVNTYPSYIASKLVSAVPLWADLNGWIMAEAQAQAYKMQSNDYLGHYMEMEDTVLKRADKFSTVSEAQRYAVLGELAGIYRLCAESFGYEFCHVVRNGIEWFEGEEDGAMLNVDSAAGSGAVRNSGAGSVGSSGEMSVAGAARSGAGGGAGGGAGRSGAGGDAIAHLKSIPSDAFILLWMGGYNTWVDEETLFRSLEKAMESCEKLYFVSTGGEIEGLDNKTFRNFKSLIEGSRYRDRFIFLGWVETKEIPYIYRSAHAGINVDRACVETFTGARNRINEMMKFGLPVITTLGSEISYEARGAGAGLAVKSGDSEALAEAIKNMYEKKYHGSVAAYGEAGKKYISEYCNYQITLKALFEWLKNPMPAPDRGAIVGGGSGAKIKSGLKYLKENGLKKFSKKVWQKIKS